MRFFENTRKPQGFGGKLMTKMMNSGHAKLSQWEAGGVGLPVDRNTVLEQRHLAQVREQRKIQRQLYAAAAYQALKRRHTPEAENPAEADLPQGDIEKQVA